MWLKFKSFSRRLLVWLLRQEASLVLRRYHPKIIGVGGNVGKTSAKDIIFYLLERSGYRVRRSVKSFNSEIGIPLAILDLPNAWSNPFKWLVNLARGLYLGLIPAAYPAWLVLEVGADRPGDIAAVVSWLKFDIVVMTRLPDQPVHSEFFESPEDLIEEKLLLPRALNGEGLAILNADDRAMMKIIPDLRAQVATYGLSAEAKVRATQIHLLKEPIGGLTWPVPVGLTFKVAYEGHSAPFKVMGPIAEHQALGVLAAIAVGLHLGLNLVALNERLAASAPPPGRLRVLPGIKETLIIDDSYNSSPAALQAALGVLAEIRIPGRKIAVLGDMLELGALTIDAHREAGAVAARSADIIVAVGVRARFIIEEALKKRVGKRKLYHFDNSQEAGQFLQNFIAAGDAILIKGSQSMRLEKVVEEIMAEPEKKAELLCRQEPEWRHR